VSGERRPRAPDRGAPRGPGPAAAAGNALGLLLRPARDDGPCAAATRWIIGAGPSSPHSGEGDDRRHGVGPPRLAARLVRNRRGHLGAWIAEWNRWEPWFVLESHNERVAR